MTTYYAFVNAFNPNSTAANPDMVARVGANGSRSYEAFGRTGWNENAAVLKTIERDEPKYEPVEIAQEEAEAIIAAWQAQWAVEPSRASRSGLV